MKTPTWAAVTASVVLTGAGLLTALALNTLPAEPTRAATAAAARPADGQRPSADDAVQRVLRAGKPTVAEFGANACAQCREMKPILEALQREHGDRLAVAVVDLVSQRKHDYIRRYRIQLMPTQIFFDAQGREIGRHQGKISGNEILARLNLLPGAAAARPAPGNPS